jgi:hypothetical protein
MKKLISSFIVVLLALFMFSACDKEVDLITNNQVAKIESFQLYDQQNLTVLASTAIIDSTALTVTAVIKGGSDITHLKPWANITLDAMCAPKMGVWTDFTAPVQYTITSGSRTVSKVWTINVSMQN